MCGQTKQRGECVCLTVRELFCSVLTAVLYPRVGHTMDVLSPFIPVLCHSEWLFHGESCPRLEVVHLGRARSSSPACTWHCSLHYLFLQATPLISYGVTFTIFCNQGPNVRERIHLLQLFILNEYANKSTDQSIYCYMAAAPRLDYTFRQIKNILKTSLTL